MTYLNKQTITKEMNLIISFFLSYIPDQTLPKYITGIYGLGSADIRP